MNSPAIPYFYGYNSKENRLIFYNSNPRAVADFTNISTDALPSTDNVFDLGGEAARWRNVRVGNDLVIDGLLTITAGNPGVGKVLTSDADGLSSWQDATINILAYSESSTYGVGAMVTVFGIPFVNKTAVTAGETFVPAKWTCLIRGLRTGVISGGANIEIDGTDPTLINITGAIQCIKVDVSPIDYQVQPFEMQPIAGVLNAHLLTGGDPKRTTHFYIQDSGTGTGQIRDGILVQSKTNRYQEMIDGAYLSFTENDIDNMIIAPIAAYSGNYATLKTYQGLGGQVLDAYTFANGTLPGRLSMVKEGDIYGNGINYVNDPNKPDTAAIPIQVDFSFRRSYEISGVLNIESASSLVVDPENYNPGEATFDPVPTGKITIQRLYVSGAGQPHVLQYGRTLYDTLDDAKQKYDTSDSFAENGDLRNVTAFAGWIFVQQGIATPIHIINACQTSQTIGRGRPSGVLSITPSQLQSSLSGKSTGVFSGGGLSGTVGQTTFDIATGTGQVIDNTVPGTTTEDQYEWTAFAAVSMTELATAKHTFVFLKKVADVVTVVQIGDDSVITETDRKTMLYLGVIRHGTGTFVGAISMPQTIVSPVNKLIDFYIATGKVRLSSGNDVTATGAGLLTVDKALGKSFGIGVNDFSDGNNTDFVDNPALVAVSMLKYSSVGHIDGALISNVDTSRYDPNGATTDSELVSLTGGGTRVAHRIWIEAVSNLVIFQYGQASYATEDDAIAQWRQEDLSLPTGLNESSYLKEVIIVQNGAANLDGAVFVPVEGIGGSGGVITPTNVIDNLLSTDPNSALSANQGRLLDGQDLANANISGANIQLIKKGGATVTIVNGAANIANANLTFNGDRTVELNNNTWSIADGANGMFVLDGDITGQAALFHNTSGFRANSSGLELVISSGDDLLINGSVGVAGQAFTSNGNNLPPTWSDTPNIANTNLKLDAARTVDLDTFPLLFIGIGAAGTPIFQLDPGNRAIMSFLGNGLEVNATGVDLTFIPGVGDLEIDGDAGTEGEVITSHGVGTPPTWETPSGGLAADSYLSINSNALTPFHTFTLSVSVAGFGNNYNVLDLIQTNLQRTIDPSGMLQTNNTCIIQTTGVYELFWSVSDDVGTQTYVHIRVNGAILSSGHSGSDTGGSGMVTTTVASLIAGDVVEFATSLTGDTDMKRPNVKINQIR